MAADFAFCIPLIGKDKAIDWQRVLDNLQATLQSILNQLDENFVVYLATNDEIDLPEMKDQRVVPLRVSETLLPSFHQLNYGKSNVDAAAKRVEMTSKAYAEGIKHVMYCDADDLVSNTLVKYVRATRHPVGYAIHHGYVFDCQSGRYLPCPSAAIPVEGFDRFCGSSIILTLSEDLRKTRNGPLDIHTVGHDKIRRTLIDENRPLLDILHPSAIYIINSGENISLYDSNDGGRKGFMQQVIWHIQTQGTPMSQDMMREFGLL